MILAVLMVFTQTLALKLVKLAIFLVLNVIYRVMRIVSNVQMDFIYKIILVRLIVLIFIIKKVLHIIFV